jgi:hypothetical protein
MIATKISKKSSFFTEPEPQPLPQPYVVVRADSGVYCGYLVEETPTGGGFASVRLAEQRHIWEWEGFSVADHVHTVEEVAARGVGPGSKVSRICAEGTVHDARAICFVTDDAVIKALREIAWAA